MRLVHLFLVTPKVVHKFPEIVGREILPGYDHRGHPRGQTDWREILDRIVLQVGVGCRRSSVRAHVSHHERVAVSRRSRGAYGGCSPTGAGHVLDNYSLAK